MEQNHGGSLVTSLNNDMLEESSPENQEKISRLEECLNILNKPEGMQAVEDLDKLSQILADTGIFNKSVIGDQEPLFFIKAILPYIKYETYMPGAAIVHYSHPHKKLCIIVKGKAKEFIAKTAKELQNERNTMKLASSYTRHENAGLKSLTDLGDDDESDIRKPRTFVKAGSLTCIMEEHEPDPSPVLKKRARPQYFGLTEPNSGSLLAPKNCMDDPFDDLKYEILGSLQISSCSNSRQSLNGTLDFEEDNVDIVSPEHLEEFKKLPVNYFLGDILKVKNSRTLGSGDSIGLECLQNKVMSREAILAVDEVHCICLYQEDYEAMLEMEKRINDEKIDFFRRLFPSFKQDVITDFALLWEEQECKRGDVIFQENEASDTLFVVFQGELTVSKDVNLPGLPLIRKNSDDPKNKKKKNTSTLQIATFCQGYFFQGTNPEILSTQVSSAKAKIFKLFLKNGKLIGENFLSILDKIKDMIKLSNQLNAERFEYLCQVFGGDESPQTKEEVPQPREKIEKTLTPIVKQFKKVKSIDARTEYGKYFVRKPGQKFPEYMQKLMDIDSTTCLTESNDQPDEIIQKSGSVVIDAKFPLATPPKITQKSERSFNFINTGRSSPFTLSEEQPKKEEVSLRNMRLIPRNAATPVDKMRTFYNSATKSDNILTATANSRPLLTPEPKKPETNTIKGQLARVLQGRNHKINNKSNPHLSQSASLTVTSAFETEDGRIRVKENRRVIIQKRECIRPITSSLNDIAGYSIGQGRTLRSRNQGERLPSIKSQDGIKYDSFGSFDGCYSIREANLTTSNDRIRNLRKW